MTAEDGRLPRYTRAMHPVCVPSVMTDPKALPPETEEFYRHTVETLREAEIPFMVGGAYAFSVYTGITRHTKDLDFSLRPRDVQRALDSFRGDRFEAEMTFPHWLA